MKMDSGKTAIKEFYNDLAQKRDFWFNKNRFYHKEMLSYYKFFIPPNSSVLELGCGTGEIVGSLSSSHGVGVDLSDGMIDLAKEKHPNIKFVCSDVEDFGESRTFDYILLAGTLGSVKNIQGLLQKLLSMSTSDTRIIISHYNELWGPLLRFAEKIGLKMPEFFYNWLSIDDIENFLNISGYEIIRKDFRIIFPFGIPLIAGFLNKIIARFPIIRRLTLTHCIIARPVKTPENVPQLKTSVILTCRDEEKNIEGLVESIPQMGAHTEIIFVEGHSKDNTIGKIKEMIEKYPNKDIKLLKQKGIGQGDAFRMGFDQAQGDFLCWLEADLTIDPQEIKMFWDAYLSGKGEYINGTRFIYKMERKSMPLFNFIGNRLFGYVLTAILKQRFTDTLCGFKAISKRNYIRVRDNINEFGEFDPFGDFQLIFGSVKSGLKVVEIPVHYRPRQYGESKAYGKTFLSFLKHACLLLRMSFIAFVKFNLF